MLATHGSAQLIINNAGVALSQTVAELGYDDFEWLMNIKFWGVVHGTKAFLPHLLKNNDGHNHQHFEPVRFDRRAHAKRLQRQ